MPRLLKLTAIRFSYSDLMELSIYSDLKATLRPNHRIMLSTNEEAEEVSDLLASLGIPFLIKSKREIWISDTVSS